ncbi:DMT family transporter [Curvibacter sp. CHRR-16]|uniref:DMT family transporter n=1 Tax=Curvibacter sp. CHRR-16 TaxID=2835872 RepID=UPI001BD97119|nr:DMT family transporter [Curvibacter sp. CHRR-16]MBT0571501.1 DMT family transporter [Curvibacter sp. CHRR-16]
MKTAIQSDLLALSAIALWGSLALLGVSLAHIPPFLLTGLALLLGGLLALPLSRFQWRRCSVPWPTLALGVYGLFGFHWLLFMALRTAPAVEANLINYLWPLGIVVLSPVFLPGTRLGLVHVLAALMGFAGAALAIVGRSDGPASGFHVGYWYAAASAFVWASYSLWTRRVARFETAAVGSFAVVSGLLSLLCHVWWEAPVALTVADAWGIVLLGLGPLGGAFFLWDAALKRGDPRRIGVLAFITPLLSTLLMLWHSGQPWGWHTVLAAALIVGAALLVQVFERP